MSFLVSCNSFQFKIYFIWYKYSYSHFYFPFVWNNFLYCLTLRLYLSLDLDWVSCRHQLLGSIFGIYSASLRLLVTSLDPFTVIIGVYFPITGYFIPLCFVGLLFLLYFLFRKVCLTFVVKLVLWCWILLILLIWKDFPWDASGKDVAPQGRRWNRHGFNPWVGKIPWRRA